MSFLEVVNLVAALASIIGAAIAIGKPPARIRSVLPVVLAAAWFSLWIISGLFNSFGWDRLVADLTARGRTMEEMVNGARFALALLVLNTVWAAGLAHRHYSTKERPLVRRYVYAAFGLISLLTAAGLLLTRHAEIF